MRTTMRTTAVALAVSSSVFAAAAATSSGAATPKPVPPRTLTVTQTYVAPTYATNETTLGVVHVGGGQFTVPSWAKYFSVAVADTSGLPTAGFAETLTRGDDRLSAVGDFCGRSSHSFSVDPAVIQAVWVTLNQGPCDDGTLGAGTTGTISVTFTN
jgi:hypothetical protein